MKKKFFGILTCAVMASALVLPACTPAEEQPPVDPYASVELKPFSMLTREADAKNSYPFGICAPADWSQIGYDLSFTDDFDIYGYCLETGKSPFPYMCYDLYTPIISLRGTDNEYAYGYADFGSSTLPASAPLSDYFDAFIEANGYDAPETVNEITMTSWTPDGEKLSGLSFDRQISTSTTERIVVFKTGKSGGYNNEDCSVFGVFHIGCDTKDFNTKKTLFDRMEKSIFGWGMKNIERYENGYFRNVKTSNYSVLGLTLQLPKEFSPFTVGEFGYANSYGNVYEVWSNDEGYTLENAGALKIEIYRDPVAFSEVFAPVTDLYALHSDDVYGLNVAPPRLTTLPDGTVAVYSVHNSYENVKEVVRQFEFDYVDYSLHVKKATRKIVYTFIHGDYIYEVAFNMPYEPTDFGEDGPTISNAIYALNGYEEYFVYKIMNNISFN